MMKSGLTVLFAALLTLVSVSASRAEPVVGCSPEVLEQMTNYNNAQRVRNKAYSQEVIKKNDNALGMTCFDRAVGLSVKLGDIFSEVIDADAGANTSSVFGMGNTSDTGQTGQTLAGALSSVIGPGLTAHVGNFGDSMSAILGAVNLNFLDGVVDNIDTTINNTVSGTISDVNGYINMYNNNRGLIDTALNLIFNASTAAIITNVIGEIINYWEVIAGIVTDNIGPLYQELKNLVQQYLNELFQQVVASLLGPNGCNFIQNLWALGEVSVTGKGIAEGVPYFDFEDMLRGVPINGGGDDFLASILSNRDANGILERAWQDINPTGGGALSGPGQMSTWPRPPDLPENPTVADIIQRM